MKSCCCCSFQLAALIWWREHCAPRSPSFLIHLSFFPLASFTLSLFYAAPLLPCFHSANQSFFPSPLLQFLSSHQHILPGGIWAKLLRQMDDDKLRDKPNFSPSTLFPYLIPSFLSFGLGFVSFDTLLQLTRMHFWEGDDVFTIRAKSFFLGNRTSIEQSKLDTNRAEFERKTKKKEISTQKSVKNPLVEKLSSTC